MMEDFFRGSKKPVRFRVKHDVTLLKCVISRNPFAARTPSTSKRTYEAIALDMNTAYEDEGFIVDGRRVRERCALILKQFQIEDCVLTRKSTETEEEFTEKMQLLQECTKLQLEESKQFRSQVEDKARLKELEDSLNPPTLVPALATNGSEDKKPSISGHPDEDCSGDDDESCTPSSAKRRKLSFYDTGELIDYFQGRQIEEKSLKHRELELKERELDLKEKELKLKEQELKMQQEKAESDKNEKTALLTLLMKHLK